MALFKRRARKTQELLSVEKGRSTSAQNVITAYYDLPLEHRPAYDVEAMVDALDLKYGGRVKWHLDVWDHEDDEWDFGARAYKSLYSCSCVWTYDDGGYGDVDSSKTCAMPEYLELYDAICKVKSELRRREEILKARALESEVEGVAHVLADIANFTAALRVERELVSEVNSLI